MNITLINKETSTKPNKSGKMYQLHEVVYKNNTYGGKVESFKVTQYMKGFPGVSEANAGDTLEVEVVKGDTGFNEWVSVSKGGSVAPVAVPQVQNVPSVQRGTVPTQAARSTYETPEERAIKQKLISRQSAINSATAILSVGAKSLKLADVLDTAKEINDWVYENHFDKTGFDTMIDDDPSVGVEVV